MVVAPSLLSHGHPPAYLTFASLTALGLPNATTTRHCPGVASFDEPIPGSPFRGDAIRMLTAAGLDLARVSYAKQVHGAEAAQAPAGGGFAGTVDILVTVEPRELARAYPDRWKAWATPGRPGRVMLDLWSANEALLRGAGVDPARVENPRLCTACHPELLYSYRRGSRGRLVTLAALP